MPQKKRGQTPVEEAVARILNALDVPEKTEEIPLTGRVTGVSGPAAAMSAARRA